MDAKTELLLSHLSEEETKSVLAGSYEKKEIFEFGLLPEDITYGLEFEHLVKPENLPDILDLLLKLGIRFSLFADCSEEIDDAYFSKLKDSPVKIPESIINEISTPVLKDERKSMYYLKGLLLIIERYSVTVPNSYKRNIHVHFDKKVLGDRFEHLRSLLLVMRAYENIIYRLTCAETGRPPKAGLSDKIGEALKKDKISQVLKEYNGSTDWYTFTKARGYGLNLANARCHYLGKSPAMVSKISDKGLMDTIFNQTRLEPNIKKNLKPGETIVKEIPPTIEFRLTPLTCKPDRLQSYLLLYNIVLGMARQLSSNRELEARVLARNKTIDEFGPEVFNVELDAEGINDMICWLPEDKKDLGNRLLVDYVCSRPLLKLDQVSTEKVPTLKGKIETIPDFDEK